MLTARWYYLEYSRFNSFQYWFSIFTQFKEVVLFLKFLICLGMVRFHACRISFGFRYKLFLFNIIPTNILCFIDIFTKVLPNKFSSFLMTRISGADKTIIANSKGLL